MAEPTEKRFIEREAVPTDALIVDRTWQYVNRDGGPDRRFLSNAEIPIAMYGELALTSPGGINARLQISDPKVATSLAAAFRGMAATGGSAPTTSPLAKSSASETAAKVQEPEQAATPKDSRQELTGEALQLATEKPPGWRGLLFARILEDTITVESAVAKTTDIGGRAKSLSNEGSFSELQAILSEAEACFPRMTTLANTAFKDAPGGTDEALPLVQAGRLLGLEYGRLASLQSRALALGGNPRFGAVASELAKALNGPEVEVAGLPARLRTALQAGLAHAKEGSPAVVDLKLVFKIDNEAALLTAVREAGRPIQDGP